MKSNTYRSYSYRALSPVFWEARVREGTEVGAHQRLCALRKGEPWRTVPGGEDSPAMGLAGHCLGSPWTGGMCY